MAVIDVNWKPDSRQLRQFAGLFLVFGGIIGGVLMWRGVVSMTGAGWIWSVAAVVGLAGLALPALIRPIYIAMMALALPIGFVVSTVLLATVYYLVVTPIGWLLRLTGYDAMHRRLDPQAATYWVERTDPADVRRYFRQY